MEELAPPEPVGHFSDVSAVSARLKQVRCRPPQPSLMLRIVGKAAEGGTAIQRR
jgi:hypothetical protein